MFFATQHLWQSRWVAKSATQPTANPVGADGCPPFLEPVPKSGAIRRAAARPYEKQYRQPNHYPILF